MSRWSEDNSGCSLPAVGSVVLLLILLLLSGCRSIPHSSVVEHRIDTIYLTKHLKDSIYINDSIYIKDGGDTVWVEKWHNKYITKELHDTAYVATHDTVPSPYPVEVKVPSELSWWQRVRMTLGEVFIGVLVLGMVLLGIKRLV